MDTLTSAPAAVNRPRLTTRRLYETSLKWPDTVPPLSDAEASKAARLLWRRFFRGRYADERGRPWRGVNTIKVRIDPRIRHAQFSPAGDLLVNPAVQGWHGTVHSLSHRFHERLRPRDPGHGDNHRPLEKEMIEHVVKSGWLDGKLKPKPKEPRPPKPTPDPLVIEHERMLARIKAWQTKAKRAETALKKLRKEEAKLRRKREATVRFTLD